MCSSSVFSRLQRMRPWLPRRMKPPSLARSTTRTTTTSSSPHWRSGWQESTTWQPPPASLHCQSAVGLGSSPKRHERASTEPSVRKWSSSPRKSARRAPAARTQRRAKAGAGATGGPTTSSADWASASPRLRGRGSAAARLSRATSKHSSASVRCARRRSAVARTKRWCHNDVGPAVGGAANDDASAGEGGWNGNSSSRSMASPFGRGAVRAKAAGSAAPDANNLCHQARMKPGFWRTRQK
mmetsp:Transcript_129296/g.360094  ORF Transcript_129296/g.360094 Transcript_129296/m.360094 type:complete len:241 (-) Transcript_129296:261-983(-)